MFKLDKIVKIVWLIIGTMLLIWLGFVQVPLELRKWESRQKYNRRPPQTKQERGPIVGGQAIKDQVEGIRRQGLRFEQVLDPWRPILNRNQEPLSVHSDDWLLIAVKLATFRRPRLSDTVADVVIDDKANYTWKSGGVLGGYRRISLGAVNIVFYRRDGRLDNLLLDQPAWINAVLLPSDPTDRFYYELATSDTNRDDRLNEQDSLTLWSSAPDGTDFSLVWMPPGKVAGTRYREPLSGDYFGTLVSDTDLDGGITQYDQAKLFRIALGDTVATQVVSEAMIAKINKIVFAEKDSLGSYSDGAQK